MITVHYYYSACVGLKTPDTSILCDPWFTEGIYDGSWYHYPRIEADPVAEIGPYEYIYVSHIHPDHYDAAFLKQYLATYPQSQVIIAPFAVNYLSYKMRADGIPHRVVDNHQQGDTAFALVPNGYEKSYDIDSGLAVTHGGHSVINMNDNPYRQEQIDALKAFVGDSLTILLTGYTGAGPYPQTYYEDSVLLAEKAEAKKLDFFGRYRRMRDAFQPKKTIPFAGKYILGGDLWHLNPHRGIADAVEVTQFDPDAVVLEDAFSDQGTAWIDTENLTPSAIRSTPYDPEAMMRYAESLKSEPMVYERYFGHIPLENIPLKRLLPKAAHNARAKMQNMDMTYYFCVQLPGNDWFVVDINPKGKPPDVRQDVSSLTPRSEILINPHYLFGLLSGVFHWNNAEVGSQFRTRRHPDVFNRDVQSFLNFFHV